MRDVMRYWFVILAASWLTACATETTQVEEEQVDVCEQAALHREACTGDYVTPPECDEYAEYAAREMLAVSCEDFDAEFKSTGKADGAFCDWFGTGCTPDEPIFGGTVCTSDAQCGEGFCTEGRCFDGVLSEEFQGVMDLFTDTVEREGGDTELLRINSETQALRRQLIENAQTSIHFSAFIIQNDDAGKEMVELFVAAAQRGVETRVLVDATTQFTFSKYALIEEMAAGGVEVLAFNPVTEWALLRPVLSITANDRLHEKMLIVDGKEAIVGGRNVGNEYFNDAEWRDVDVYVSGPALDSIQEMFLNIWDKNSNLEHRAGCPSQMSYGFYCPPQRDLKIVNDLRYYANHGESGDARIRAVYSDPLVQETPLGYFTTLALVRAAQSSVVIANSYFVPPRRLRKHLKAAVERGVKVQVLTNSLQSTDAWWMYYASINYYKELISAGVEIYQFKGTETMHAKTMLIDDSLAVVGSFNLDPRSAIDNSESMLLIRDSAAVEQLKQGMAEDFAFADRATADIPLNEMLKAKSMRLVEPLL